MLVRHHRPTRHLNRPQWILPKPKHPHLDAVELATKAKVSQLPDPASLPNTNVGKIFEALIVVI